MRRLAVVGMVLALAACGQAYKLRPLSPDESNVLGAAANPLLRQLGYLRSQSPCRFGTSFNDVQGRQLEVLRSKSPEACLTFYLTAGALSLPREELRALVAHSLGHLHLDHESTTGRRVSTRVGAGTASVFTQARIYTPEEETAADRYAAGLLKVASPGPQGEGCRALGAMLERAAREGDRWEAWTEQHPLAPARATAAREFCTSPR